MNEVFAFELSVKGDAEIKTIINAHHRGQAKGQFYRRVTEYYEVAFTNIRCCKVGAPATSEGFERNAIYRGWDGVKCGARVKVGTDTGAIVGHNRSANFDILFDLDSSRYPGMRLNVHPADCELVN